MNLCRVLPNGADAKAAVDAAIDACAPIGNLRADIHACKQAAEGGLAGFGGEEEGEPCMPWWSCGLVRGVTAVAWGPASRV